MAQTGISLASAVNAGIVAGQINSMNIAISKLNSLVGGPPGSPLMISILGRTPGNDVELMAGLNLNAADSAVIFNQIFVAFQTLAAQYAATLANMPIT